MGAYQELKNANTENERKRRKKMLVNQLHAKTGFEKKLCEEALDILEAVIFKTSHYTSMQTSVISGVKPNKKISIRTIIFGIVGAISGLIGSSIGGEIAQQFYGDKIKLVIHWTIWIAMVAILIILGLLISQSIYLKKKLKAIFSMKAIVLGILISIATGILAGVVVSFREGDNLSRTIAWGFTGIGIGFAATLFISNFPKVRAIIAGLIGGVVGFILSFPFSVYVGDMVIGLSVGSCVSIVEEALRQAWLTIIWGKNETRTISLGDKPIVFGSSSSADIYLSKDTEPSVRATVQIENAKVVMHDKKNNQQRELKNGEQVDFGKVRFVVNIKRGNIQGK
jgi:Ca-activated chloride channel family protein